MMFRPGEIVEVRRHCGAYTTASKGCTARRGMLLAESLVVVLDRHDFASELRAQTMVEILHHDEILIIDERHLKACNPSADMV